jgi:hypothetical protein
MFIVSILIRLFIIIVPFIFVVASCYMAIRKDLSGTIVFGIGGIMTSAFANWLFCIIANSRIHEEINTRFIPVLVAILIVFRLFSFPSG